VDFLGRLVIIDAAGLPPGQTGQGSDIEDKAAA